MIAEPTILNSPVALSNPKMLDSRTVRDNPGILATPDVPPTDCVEFVRRVRLVNEELMIETYGDALHQNANLSNQIATRLDSLVEDTENLDTRQERDQFFSEYTLIADRYLDSNRFRVGLGAIYSYLPKVEYSGIARIDFSPYQTTASGGADRLLFNQKFSNIGYLSPLITVKAPFLDIDFAFPDLETTQTTIPPILFRDTDDPMTEMLAQSTIASTVEIEYEIGIRVALGKLFKRRKNRAALRRLDPFNTIRDPKSIQTRFDWGVGVGMAGFLVENSVSTDVRLRTDPTDTFNDLTSEGTIATQDDRNINTAFAVGYFKVRVNDEIEVGIDYKKYENDSANGGQISVGGDTVSISAAWYPTFSIKN